MIKIYSAASLLDAQMVCDALLEAGLDSRVSGGFLTGAAGELPVDSLVSVWLTEPLHQDRARRIIDDIEQRRREPAVELACRQCGELVDSRFSHCWNCSASLPQE